jgi:thioredoxin-related protein
MKRNLFFLFLISAAVWTGCKQSSSPAGSAGIPAVAVMNTTPVNLAAEIARAKAENKLLFLEFGSSDSCPPCIQFEQQVFSKPEFLGYAKSNLVFVRFDYPLKTQLPPAVQMTNILVAQQFAAFLFPTFIALDHEGKEFWRFPEKENPNPTIDTTLYVPKNFIALLESLKVKLK